MVPGARIGSLHPLLVAPVVIVDRVGATLEKAKRLPDRVVPMLSIACEHTCICVLFVCLFWGFLKKFFTLSRDYLSLHLHEYTQS